MEFARIGLLGALLIGMWKGSSTTRKGPPLDLQEASLKRGPTKEELKGRRRTHPKSPRQFQY